MGIFIGIAKDNKRKKGKCFSHEYDGFSGDDFFHDMTVCVCISDALEGKLKKT